MKCPRCLDGQAVHVPNGPGSTGYTLKPCAGCTNGCDACEKPAEPDSALCQGCANEKYLRDGEASWAGARAVIDSPDPLAPDVEAEPVDDVLADRGDAYRRFNAAWREGA